MWNVRGPLGKDRVSVVPAERAQDPSMGHVEEDDVEQTLTPTRRTGGEAVSIALCRRFMRKPNFGEAAYEFAELKMQMKREGFPQYAAFCALAVARCEQAVGRTPQEAAQYRDAGAQRSAPGHPLPTWGHALNTAYRAGFRRRSWRSSTALCGRRTRRSVVRVCGRREYAGI